MSDDPECLNCGAPAAYNPGTVPLCPRCTELAKGQSRGVRFQKKDAPQDSHQNAGL